jgi:hypothetical protein
MHFFCGLETLNAKIVLETQQTKRVNKERRRRKDRVILCTRASETLESEFVAVGFQVRIESDGALLLRLGSGLGASGTRESSGGGGREFCRGGRKFVFGWAG